MHYDREGIGVGAGQIASTVRTQRMKNSFAPLAFSFDFSLRHQPIEWYFLSFLKYHVLIICVHNHA